MNVVCVPLPDLLAFPEVIQREEDVCVFSDGVVGEALQVDDQVVGDRDPTGLPVTLTHAVTLDMHAHTHTSHRSD